MKTDQQLWVELKWEGVGGFEENHGLSFSQVNFCDKIAFDLNFLFNRRFCCILCVLIILCVYAIKIIKITALCIFTYHVLMLCSRQANFYVPHTDNKDTVFCSPTHRQAIPSEHRHTDRRLQASTGTQTSDCKGAQTHGQVISSEHRHTDK